MNAAGSPGYVYQQDLLKLLVMILAGYGVAKSAAGTNGG